MLFFDPEKLEPAMNFREIATSDQKTEIDFLCLFVSWRIRRDSFHFR